MAGSSVVLKHHGTALLTFMVFLAISSMLVVSIFSQSTLLTKTLNQVQIQQQKFYQLESKLFTGNSKLVSTYFVPKTLEYKEQSGVIFIKRRSQDDFRILEFTEAVNATSPYLGYSVKPLFLDDSILDARVFNYHQQGYVAYLNSRNDLQSLTLKIQNLKSGAVQDYALFGISSHEPFQLIAIDLWSNNSASFILIFNHVHFFLYDVEKRKLQKISNIKKIPQNILVFPGRQPGVGFLDPLGIELNFETGQAVASTRSHFDRVSGVQSWGQFSADDIDAY